MHRTLIALVTILSLTAAGCGSDSPTAPDITGTQFAPSLGVNSILAPAS